MERLRSRVGSDEPEEETSTSNNNLVATTSLAHLIDAIPSEGEDEMKDEDGGLEPLDPADLDESQEEAVDVSDLPSDDRVVEAAVDGFSDDDENNSAGPELSSELAAAADDLLSSMADLEGMLDGEELRPEEISHADMSTDDILADLDAALQE